jgi:O-antigen ligase
MKDPLLLLACVALTAALLFGGGARQGLGCDAIPELIALPLLALAPLRAWPYLKRSPGALALLIGVIALPCAQLVPLPPWLWSALPGREPLVDIFAAAEVPLSWRPTAVIPGATWRALLSLAPPAAFFLATLSLDRDARRLQALVVTAIGVVSVPIAMLQVIGGPDSGLYFFDVTNIGKGVGFFANANHFGAFEYALLPLSAAALTESRIRSHALSLAILGGVVGALLFGLSLSGSRAAIILGGFSFFATIAIVLRPEVAKLGRRRAFGIAIGLGLMLVPLLLGLGMLTILERFATQDLVEDSRWTLAAVTWRALWSYFPFGSGFGTFPSVYPLHERITDLIPQFVNRAHDDLLEILLEGGLASLALLLGFVVWLCFCTRRALVSERAADGRQARAGIIVMWLLLLHSVVDYPLRTIALESVLALCAAFQFKPPPADHGREVWWSGLCRRRRRHKRKQSPALLKPVEDAAPAEQ